MSAAILPFRPPELTAPPPRGPAGVADIAFAGRPSRLAQLHQRAPLRVLLPHAAEGEPPTAVVANLSGGIVAGDDLAVTVSVEQEARAVVTTQAAEKVYRSAGSTTASVTARLDAGADALLEWLPMETILFQGARLERDLSVAVAAGGRCLAGEMVVFGRTARGETLTRGSFADSWEVRYDDKLVWADRLCLDRPAAILPHPAGFAGARAMATFVYVGNDAGMHIDCARSLEPEDDAVRFGVTVIGPVLVARWLAPRAEILRPAYADFRRRFRAAAAGLPACLPTIWEI